MTEVDYGSFRQAAHYYRGRVQPIRLVVLHATAGLENAKGKSAEQVQAMFADPGSRVASAHITCDQDSIARSVHDGDTAFAAKYANACGLHVEQVGLTTQTREQWLDPISKATIANTARVVGDWCELYAIERQRLTVAEVRLILADPRGTRLSGITDHATVQAAKPSTGHTDPGPDYPWDYFLSLLNPAQPASEEDCMFIIKCAGKTSLLIECGRPAQALGRAATIAAYEAAGVRSKTLPAAQYDILAGKK